MHYKVHENRQINREETKGDTLDVMFMTLAVAKTVKEDRLSVVLCDVTGEVAGSFSTDIKAYGSTT